MPPYIRAAGAVLRFTRKQGWIREVPELPKLPKPVRKARDVELGQLGGALDQLPKRAGQVLRFIAHTACRPSEACQLEWRRVHLDAGVCILDTHKTANETGEPRTIYLRAEAAAVVRSMRPTIGLVFTNRFGRAYTPNGLCSILRRHGGITPLPAPPYVRTGRVRQRRGARRGAGPADGARGHDDDRVLLQGPGPASLGGGADDPASKESGRLVDKPNIKRLGRPANLHNDLHVLCRSVVSRHSDEHPIRARLEVAAIAIGV
jgi:hypothetical protein